MEGIIFKKRLITSSILTCCFYASFSGYVFASDEGDSGKYLLFNKPYVSYPDPKTVEVPLPSLASTNVDVEQSIPEAPTPSEKAANIEDMVDLLADQVEYDEVNAVVSAVGNVELVQAGRILRADKVTYDLNKDDVTATGNVVLNEITGDTYFAEFVDLKGKMKNGFIQSLSGVLADGSRFSADKADKIADAKVIMHRATYTACEPCKKHPSRAPLWQIKAKEVTHHKDQHRVSYDNATFEVAGLPVAYVPYFSHPDGSVDRKSGFLIPSIGFDSELGVNYGQEYYWNIAPDKDATIGVTAYTEETPLLTTEYRQRFKDAEIITNSGVTYSSRTDSVNDQDVDIDDELRGHLFVDGLWDINEKWRAGTEIQLVSDDQYLRQYNLSNEDILENTAYLERFSGRDYVNARLINFQDLRVSDRSDDQPNILPEIYTRFIGKPNATLGGRWEFETSLLGLQREGNDQDLNRASAQAGWQRRHVSDIGLVNTLDFTARGDAFQVNDRDIATIDNQRSTDSSAIRGFAQAHLQSSYPVAKRFKRSELVIEPLTSVTIGTNLDEDDDIPNEDSQDVFLDVTNLFNANRFPGYDRIEDGSFTTYGLRTGLYGDNGYSGEVFLGQSYRFKDSENPFPSGSGLSEQSSDFVGNVSISAGRNLQLNYGLQLDNDSLSSQRHEIDMTGQVGKVSFNTRYFYANALEGTDFDESREQIRVGGRYQFSDRWGVIGNAQYDFSDDNEGLRFARYGLDYKGQCVDFLLSAQRTLTNDSSGDSGTEITLRLGLKNLGGFETSGFAVGSNGSDNDSNNKNLE